MASKIGVLGSGSVAKVLAEGLLKSGHEVMLGSRDISKLEEFKSLHPGVKTGTFEETVDFGGILVLAVKGIIAESLVKTLAPRLSGKIVIDTTNPIADAPPVNGVLQFFTTLTDSLMERLQTAAPDARFVKAFNIVGANFMVHPAFKDGKPSMFICGNDPSAKKKVSAILTDFGWEPLDYGKVESARAIEPLCMLWCIPGMLRNEWIHAFKLLKVPG